MNRQPFTAQIRKQHIMSIALEEGMYTDHLSDGICEELLDQGWLERAAPIAPRPHVSRSPAYLPTEKAVAEWNNELPR